MVLIDFSQTMLSTWLSIPNSDKMNEELFRHMVISNLLSYKKKFEDEYGEMVICCDDRHYWRKQLFPQYKANRKKDREASSLDWNEIFTTLNKVRDEIKEFLPWVVLHIESAEADDLIATMILGHANDKHVIISSDKDFAQLQIIPNVDQYSPRTHEFINIDDPEGYLVMHILRGDMGDGIPNVRSSDNALVDNIRQKPITKKLIEEVTEVCRKDPEKKVLKMHDIWEGWKRNEQLISLFMLPSSIKAATLVQYNNANPPSDVQAYLDKYKLERLKKRIGDFI